MLPSQRAVMNSEGVFLTKMNKVLSWNDNISISIGIKLCPGAGESRGSDLIFRQSRSHQMFNRARAIRKQRRRMETLEHVLVIVACRSLPHEC